MLETVKMSGRDKMYAEFLDKKYHIQSFPQSNSVSNFNIGNLADPPYRYDNWQRKRQETSLSF